MTRKQAAGPVCVLMVFIMLGGSWVMVNVGGGLAVAVVACLVLAAIAALVYIGRVVEQPRGNRVG